MLTALTNYQRLETTALWVVGVALDLVLLLAGRRRRFALLTPPFLGRQTIYDRNSRKLIRVNIRDRVDYSVVRQIFVKEDYGLEKLRRANELGETYRAIIGAGRIPLIVDCGANSGMAVRYFTETYEDAFVVAIEPDASNLNAARSNNISKKVSYRLAGIGSSDSRATIRDPGEGNWAYQVEENQDGETVIVSMDSLLGDYDQSTYVPFIVKIDIGGFEANLFEKNTEWVDRFPVLIIELHGWMLPGQANSRNFLRQVSSRDRDFVFFGENVFSISNARAGAGVSR